MHGACVGMTCLAEGTVLGRRQAERNFLYFYYFLVHCKFCIGQLTLSFIINLWQGLP